QKNPAARYPTTRHLGAALLRFASPHIRTQYESEFGQPSEHGEDFLAGATLPADFQTTDVGTPASVSSSTAAPLSLPTEGSPRGRMFGFVSAAAVVVLGLAFAFGPRNPDLVVASEVEEGAIAVQAPTPSLIQNSR